MSDPISKTRRLSKRDYESLANFRYALRGFLAFSETAANAVGLSPQQHQALLAIKGSRNRDRLSIGEIGERLGVRHHTAVELVNRLESRGLIKRKSDANDARRVHVHLTRKAGALIETLSHAHIKELQGIRPALERLISGLSG
jgi:DNA-binding MarR family transcriptional regulator